MYLRFYTCTTELIHVFQILHVYYGTYTGLTDLIRVLQNLYLFSDTRVPVGTTELILIY